MRDDTERIDINGLYPNYWPEHWGEEDIEFLAEFIHREFDARLVKEYDPDESVWSLRVPKAAEYYAYPEGSE